ncbi:MAG: permease [Gemmatales bacterium]|nr:permease [Gemmatales bacterium]MDW7993886.1 permease [Gemmatales bacterium]
MSDNAVERFLVIFISIFFEALPFIALGALISGTLEELLPQGAITRLLPRRRSLAMGASALLGLMFPMCECGIVPVMRRLLRKGLPLSCAVAYMLAAPVINPVVIASTWAAFSGDRSGLDGLTSMQMVGWRVGLAFVTAVTVAHVVQWADVRYGPEALLLPIRGAAWPRAERNNSPEAADDPPGATVEKKSAVRESEALPFAHAHRASDPTPPRWPWYVRLANIAEIAIHDFLEITCFLILGATLAAIVQSAELISYFPALKDLPILAVPAMMLLAVLLCLCSEADAFVAANLIAIPFGGKLAFLVLGPMLDLKLYMMYTRVFRPRLIWTIIGSVAITVGLLALSAHYLDAFVRGSWIATMTSGSP